MKSKKQVKKVTAVKPLSLGISPIGDRILLKPLTSEEAHRATSFGILIPDSAKEKPEQGVVVAVGGGKRSDTGTLIPMSIKVGDKVMFSKYGYDEVKINGTEYYIVNESNILAVLN